MELLIGGLAASCSGVCTNPLDVVKTRMQLQGELQSRGHYAVHYRNVFHAFYKIAKVDGILALQRGLAPAISYQFVMNGARLGVFQYLNNFNLLNSSSSTITFAKTVAAGSFSGTIGAICASPFYMIKTQMQSNANNKIAVGYQHKHNSMISAFSNVIKKHGVFGLWHGASGAVMRAIAGSGAQLSTFSTCKQYIINKEWFDRKSIMNTFLAAMVSGVVIACVMTPFDVVSTRLYNQGKDANGRGLFYNHFGDCFYKIFKNEGPMAFYKGLGASYFRLGPHTVLTFVFWHRIQNDFETLKKAYYCKNYECSSHLKE